MSFISTYAYRWFGIFEFSREGLRSRHIELSWRPGLALEASTLLRRRRHRATGSTYHLGWPQFFMKLPCAPIQDRMHWGSLGPGVGVLVCRDRRSISTGVTRLRSSTCRGRLERVLGRAICSRMVHGRISSLSEKLARLMMTRWAAREERRSFIDENEWRAEYPYRYVLRSGEVQERTATVNVEEREWRQHWLEMDRPVSRMCGGRFPSTSATRSASALARGRADAPAAVTSYASDETPEQCLRRMEAERKF
jgi:hypothetical protein